MTIINPIHPLYGQSVVIQQIRKVGQDIKVTVESPLGGFLSLPADETDLWTQQATVAQRTEKFLPEKLLRAIEWVAARSPKITEEFSCVPENQGAKHRKNSNGTKASTTDRSTGKLRKNKSSNKTNSTVSGQDTRKQKPGRGDSKE